VGRLLSHKLKDRMISGGDRLRCIVEAPTMKGLGGGGGGGSTYLIRRKHQDCNGVVLIFA